MTVVVFMCITLLFVHKLYKIIFFITVIFTLITVLAERRGHSVCVLIADKRISPQAHYKVTLLYCMLTKEFPQEHYKVTLLYCMVTWSKIYSEGELGICFVVVVYGCCW